MQFCFCLCYSYYKLYKEFAEVVLKNYRYYNAVG